MIVKKKTINLPPTSTTWVVDSNQSAEESEVIVDLLPIKNNTLLNI